MLRSLQLSLKTALFFFILVLSGAGADSAPPALPHQAYVWQRAWTDPLRAALRQHASAFDQLVVLRAEVTWRSGKPTLINVPVDYAALAGSTPPPPVGLALRIGPYPGPFARNDPTAQFLLGLARSMLAEARTNGLRVREFQLDFDCAESKLDGYRVWVETLRAAIAPVPLTITVLPSWLDRPSFRALALATDGFVLQVHSLEKPRDSSAQVSLCDPTLARRAVAQANGLRVPFRVALPTYGYLLAFDSKGKFIGLSAEGPLPSWPAGTQVRELRSDPGQQASLVKLWTAERPAHLQGIIWYRFPVSGDILNWRWPTLSAIMASRSPRESMRADPRRVEPGLIEISLVNDGELDISSRLAVEVRWPRDGEARLLAADGLRGFEVVEQTNSTLQLKSQSQPFRLPAGEQQVIGWLRFSKDREVQVECKKF